MALVSNYNRTSSSNGNFNNPVIWWQTLDQSIQGDTLGTKIIFRINKNTDEQYKMNVYWDSQIIDKEFNNLESAKSWAEEFNKEIHRQTLNDFTYTTL